MKTYIYYISIIIIALSSCKPEPKSNQMPPTNDGKKDTLVSNTILFSIQHLYQGADLAYDTIAYANSSGQMVNFRTLKYFLANVKLKQQNGNWISFPNQYGLIVPSKKQMQFKLVGVPNGVYNEIQFQIGIDSMVNHSNPMKFPTSQVGKIVDQDFPNDSVLRPEINQDMHWTWNTGYIFLKLEGRYRKKDGTEMPYFFHLANDNNKLLVPFSGLNFTINNNQRKVNLTLDAYRIFNGTFKYNLEEDGDFSHSTNDNGIFSKLKPNLIESFSVKNIE